MATGYEDIDEVILQLKEHFKDNFMLEIQYHIVSIMTQNMVLWAH